MSTSPPRLRSTRAFSTQATRSTRCSTAPVSTKRIGSPLPTPAACCTSAGAACCAPVTRMRPTSRRDECVTIHAAATTAPTTINPIVHRSRRRPCVRNTSIRRSRMRGSIGFAFVPPCFFAGFRRVGACVVIPLLGRRRKLRLVRRRSAKPPSPRLPRVVADHVELGHELHATGLRHPALHLGNEVEHVAGGGTRVGLEEVGVLL